MIAIILIILLLVILFERRGTFRTGEPIPFVLTIILVVLLVLLIVDLFAPLRFWP